MYQKKAIDEMSKYAATIEHEFEYFQTAANAIVEPIAFLIANLQEAQKNIGDLFRDYAAELIKKVTEFNRSLLAAWLCDKIRLLPFGFETWAWVVDGLPDWFVNRAAGWIMKSIIKNIAVNDPDPETE